MVGKPNLPPDSAEREDIQGAASAAPGLGALDQERAASMADEGGAAAAFAEADDDSPSDAWREGFPDDVSRGSRRLRRAASLALAGVAGTAAYVLVRRWRS
jgi:hypothetical protein